MCRHVTRLRLDDGQRRQRTFPCHLAHLRGALEQPRVDVEDVAGVGLAAGRAAEQQRHLAVGDGLLREVVVEDDGVLAVVPEVLAHGAARVGCQELERGGLRRRRRDHNAVLHRVLLF